MNVRCYEDGFVEPPVLENFDGGASSRGLLPARLIVGIRMAAYPAG